MMSDNEKLCKIQDEYTEIAFDIESMVSMVKVYEDKHLYGEKNEVQDMIRVIKIVAESVADKVNKINYELDELMVE